MSNEDSDEPDLPSIGGADFARAVVISLASPGSSIFFEFFNLKAFVADIQFCFGVDTNIFGFRAKHTQLSTVIAFPFSNFHCSFIGGFASHPLGDATPDLQSHATFSQLVQHRAMEQSLFDHSILDEDFLYELDFSPPASPCFVNATRVDKSVTFDASTPVTVAPIPAAAAAVSKGRVLTAGNHTEARSISKFNAEHQHNAWLDAQFSREIDELPTARHRQRSPAEVNAGAVQYHDLAQHPHIVHASPVKSSLPFSLDRSAVEYHGPVVYTNAVETVAIHLIFVGAMFDTHKLPWLPACSSGSAPTDVRVCSDINVALCHVVKCHQRANATLVGMVPQHGSASQPSCHYLYVLVVNTRREMPKGTSYGPDGDWDHQWISSICQGVENTISGPGTATIRVLRAGDAFNENGIITKAQFADEQIRVKIAKQIAENLNSISPDIFPFADESCEISIDSKGTDSRAEVVEDAGVLSQFTRDLDDSMNIGSMNAFVLQPHYFM